MPFWRHIRSDNFYRPFKCSRLWRITAFTTTSFPLLCMWAQSHLPSVSISDLWQTIYCKKGENLCRVIKSKFMSAKKSAPLGAAQFISCSALRSDIISILTAFFNSLWIRCRKWCVVRSHIDIHSRKAPSSQRVRVFIAPIVTLFTIFLFVRQPRSQCHAMPTLFIHSFAPTPSRKFYPRLGYFVIKTNARTCTECREPQTEYEHNAIEWWWWYIRNLMSL